MKRKAQLQIQQMAFMLVGIILFFILVGLFALSIVYSSLEKGAGKIEEERVLSSISNLADAPEFSCVGSKINCIDGDKVVALMQNNNYKNFWPFTSLVVVRESGFDKSEEDMINCNADTWINESCDKFVIYDKEAENERLVSSFVSLCNTKYDAGVYEKCELAKFIAGSEVR